MVDSKKKILSTLDSIMCVIALLFPIYVIGVVSLPRIVVSVLAQNPKNIQSNGCLKFAYAGRYGEQMVFINHSETPNSVNKITLKEFPFSKKMDEGLFPGQFKDYKDKCLKIKYIHVDLWIWGSGDHVYDIDE